MRMRVVRNCALSPCAWNRLTSRSRSKLSSSFWLRWYVSNAVSLKLEALENLFQKADGSIDDQVYVSFGVSIATIRGKP